MSLIDVVNQLTKYKAWANQALFIKLNSISNLETKKDLRAIISTLNHAYVVDCIFKAHLEKKSHSYKDVNTYPLPTLEHLYDNVTELDKWYIEFTQDLSGEELDESLQFQLTNGEDICMTRSEIILHVVNHGTYHRGNVGVLLLQNSILPEKDVITNFLREKYV